LSHRKAAKALPSLDRFYFFMTQEIKAVKKQAAHAPANNKNSTKSGLYMSL
jgi:hypothetical protein